MAPLRLTGPAEAVEAIRARVYVTSIWLVAAIIVLLGVCALRVVQLKVAPGDRLEPILEPRPSRHIELARRGDILDARGRVVATSHTGHRLFIDPAVTPDLPVAIGEIAARIGGQPEEYMQIVERARSQRYVVLVDPLLDWQADAIRAARLRGVGVEPRLVRERPFGQTAQLIVGHDGGEPKLRSGLEARHDALLTQTDGEIRMRRDASGRPLWIEAADYRPRRDGSDLRITIDMVIQEFAEHRLEQAAEEFNARGARGVIVDVETGAVLAMVDVLRHRPRHPQPEVIEYDSRDRLLRGARNRCVTDPFEPGSVFKTFFYAKAIELGKARADEILPLPNGGVYRTSRGRSIRDVRNYGPMSFRSSLIKSLNSGMALVGERMTPVEQRRAFEAFGFGAPTGVGIPGESSGRLTPLRQWNHYTLTSTPMGQEIAVTTVQLAQAFLPFCRDGSMPSLHLVVPDPSAGQQSALPEPRQVLPAAVAHQVRDALREAVIEGTGRRANSDRYEIFGKTGTAQLAIPKRLERTVGRRGFFQDRYISGFIAGAPHRRPRIAVVVTIDDPDRRREHFGGVVAAPVARDLIDFTLAYLGVEPDRRALELARDGGRR